MDSSVALSDHAVLDFDFWEVGVKKEFTAVSVQAWVSNGIEFEILAHDNPLDIVLATLRLTGGGETDRFAFRLALLDMGTDDQDKAWTYISKSSSECGWLNKVP